MIYTPAELDAFRRLAKIVETADATDLSKEELAGFAVRGWQRQVSVEPLRFVVTEEGRRHLEP